LLVQLFELLAGLRDLEGIILLGFFPVLLEPLELALRGFDLCFFLFLLG
jgi:hypothetical protein